MLVRSCHSCKYTACARLSESFVEIEPPARRLVAERGVRLNGVVIDDPFRPVAIKTGDILQRGKRRFVRCRVV